MSVSVRRPLPILVAAVAAAIFASSLPEPQEAAAAPPQGIDPAKGIDNIDHFVFIVQENRSFDHYFGTFPGANGLPRRADGTFKACVPNPETGGCVKPWHDRGVHDHGGAHNKLASDISVNGGAMDGFIEVQQTMFSTCRKHPKKPECILAAKDGGGRPDVMGFHTAKEIPNYWAYARKYLLQDRMFAPTDSWTLPAHLYLVSGWSARCPDLRDVNSCVTDVQTPHQGWDPSKGGAVPYIWGDITWLMHQQGVSWAYYVGPNTCIKDPCVNKANGATSFNKNPLAGFETVRSTRQLRHIRPYSEYYAAAKAGTLPSVSWIVPTKTVSEHPPQGVDDGQAFVTRLVNAIMRGPRRQWMRTAIFVVWDDWGGFYDHVVPPRVDAGGYGIRAPAFVISPWVKRGMDVDHQTLTFDAYLKLIEDRFLGGQRLDGENMGWPDPRPTIREEVSILGDLRREFDFSQRPIPRLILDPRPLG